MDGILDIYVAYGFTYSINNDWFWKTIYDKTS